MAARQFNTIQEAMDYSVQQIAKQGRRCMASQSPHPGYRCAYANHLKEHCAIGWLMDPDTPNLDRYDESLATIDSKLLPPIVLNNMDAFRLLQSFHDAERADERRLYQKSLFRLGVDTSGDHWQKWVRMGR